MYTFARGPQRERGRTFIFRYDVLFFKCFQSSSCVYDVAETQLPHNLRYIRKLTRAVAADVWGPKSAGIASQHIYTVYLLSLFIRLPRIICKSGAKSVVLSGADREKDCDRAMRSSSVRACLLCAISESSSFRIVKANGFLNGQVCLPATPAKQTGMRRGVNARRNVYCVRIGSGRALCERM